METSPEWLKLRHASKYAGVCSATLKKWFNNGLKYVDTPTGCKLIKREWIDDFLITKSIDKSQHLNTYIDSIFEDLN